ncbi:hypothetical protein HJC23_009781 [Cyclotella cryptica]|uniref:Uncharacterized protein n=1 Tax=Cyclotella cryptica TaxID=29204 RepID=A0ABD3PTH6_9STRA
MNNSTYPISLHDEAVNNDRIVSDPASASPSSSLTPASPSSSLQADAAASTNRCHNDDHQTEHDDDERIRELRTSLGVDDDYPTSVLRAILEANDRESLQNSIGTTDDALLDADSQNTTSRRRHERLWENCQPAPSRPGIVRINFNDDIRHFEIGQLDEAQLYSRRVDAVHSVQENLNRRLGYNLRESGQYEEMERLEAEGEERLASSGYDASLRPSLMVWDVPTMSEERMSRREPMLPPPPDDPLPLPESLLGSVMDGRSDSNYELCRGIFVDPGPGNADDDEKREEGSSTSSSKERWASISLEEGQPPMGPYEHVVRCYKCRAGLRVNIGAGLVICPRCRTISPATDVAHVG